MGLLLWLCVILMAITLHEWAHYICARLQKVEVKAFSIGMGPVVFARNWRGTQWRLSAFPIGGYVEIDGMAPTERDGVLQPAKTGFAALRSRGKLLILAAGPLSNFVLALLLLTGIYIAQGQREVIQIPNRAQIASVVGQPARDAGFKDGDVIVKIDGQPLPKTEVVDDVPRGGYLRVQDALRSGGSHVFQVVRQGKVLDVSFTWNPKPQELFGISYGPQQQIRTLTFENPVGAFWAALKFVVSAVPNAVFGFVDTVQKVFSNPLDKNTGAVGPVGSSQIAGRFLSEMGILGAIEFAVMINLSLAILNLLPIPGLDGGRILLVLVERMRRKQLRPEQEGWITFLGFSFLMLFMFLVLLGDLTRLFL